MWGHMTYADAHRYSTPVDRPGDKVWLSTRDLCLHLPCRKLSPRYKPVSPSVTEPKEPAVPPPPEIIEEPVVYRVQGILDSWCRLVVYVVGHQEPPLVEGVLSESHHSHCSLQQWHSQDPNPRNSNHRHLSALISSTISLQSSRTLTVWSQTFHAWLTRPLPFVYLSAIILTICSSFSTGPALHRYTAPSRFRTPWKGKRTLT